MNAVHPLEVYRARQEMSRADLARIFEVDRVTIWRWEKGTRTPDREQLAKVAAITGASFDEIIRFPQRLKNGAAINA